MSRQSPPAGAPAPAPAPGSGSAGAVPVPSPSNHADRVAAVRTAALVNLLKKAQQGKTLTATDWKELRRLAQEAGLASDPPWIYEQLQQLSTAIGVSVRTIEGWRAKGAPLPVDGPHDELRLRLWHLGQPASAKLRSLSDPSPTLAPYIEQARAATAAAGVDKDTEGKPRLGKLQEEKLALHNAGAKRRLVAEAEDHFLRRLGELERILGRTLTGTKLFDLWTVAQGTRVQAEPRMIQVLRALLASALAETLAAGRRK